MRAKDLSLQELLEFDPNGGPLRWAGRRVLILDVLALGHLRKELVGTVGLRTAHTGALQYWPGQPRIPAAAVSGEDANRISRLSAGGRTVSLP